MSVFFHVSFSLIEWLAITGLTQCFLILTYILLRIYNWRQTVTPLLFFGVLTLAFCMQFALRLEDFEQTIRLILWSSWALAPPMSYLLISQISYSKAPRLRQYWVILLPLFVIFGSLSAQKAGYLCDIEQDHYCNAFFSVLHLGSGVVGAISLLFLFGHKDLFEDIKAKAKGGQERYWLVISLILMNLSGVGINIYRAADDGLTVELADALLLIIGLGFSYLATTMFFRIYPPAIALKNIEKKKKTADLDSLSDHDYALAMKIQDLMELDKLYHEPNFSRSDLARELKISENALSGIINTAFGKTFPQLLNQHRVEDAKRMLENPNIPIQTVAFEVGFNSLPSFNRVFKNIVGKSPSNYRNDQS